MNHYLPWESLLINVMLNADHTNIKIQTGIKIDSLVSD